MKKILFIACCLLFTATASMAQKYAIIDTTYILDKMPDYTKAQKQLDDIASDWQKDIDSQTGKPG